MSAIPGTRFDVTGASGTQGFLSPKDSYRVFLLPQGAYASQSSTGTLITVDSSDIAARFAANNWVQVGLSVANIRQVGSVGGNSFSVSPSVTVTKGDRIYLIGNTQPTVNGSSATYTVPASSIYQRDDDTADRYTNSMVTTNSNGTVQFYAANNTFDALVQDGNQTLQAGINDIVVGSSATAQIFNAAVLFNAGFGVTGAALFANTVTVNGAFGSTGWATFGSTVTMNAALGVTGTAKFGLTTTVNGNFGVTGTAVFGGSASFSQGVTFSGPLTGPSLTVSISGISITGTTVLLGSSTIGTTELKGNAVVAPIRTVRFGTTAVTLTNSESVRGFTIYTPSPGNTGVMVSFCLPYGISLGTADGPGTARARLYIGNVIKCEASAQWTAANAAGVSWAGTVSATHFEPSVSASGITFEIRDVGVASAWCAYRGDLMTAGTSAFMSIMEMKR